MIALCASLLGACATATYVRDETQDFVAAGETAVEASTAFYGKIDRSQADLVKMILVNHPDCRLSDSILIRRSITDAAIAFAPASVQKIPGNPDAWDCKTELTASNASSAFCATDGVVACRNEAIAKHRGGIPAPFDVNFEYGTPFETKPLDRKRFAASLALTQAALSYLSILENIAERPADAKTYDARLSGLLDRVNVTACRIDSLRAGSDGSQCSASAAGDGNAASAVAALFDDEVTAALHATASMFDLIAAIRDDARASKSIAAALQKEGPQFEATLNGLILDLENKRKAYLAQIGMESVEQVRLYWLARAPHLSPDERATVFEQYWSWRTTTEGYLSSPAEPVRMLEQVLDAHQDLTQLALFGPQNEEQRSAIAKIQRERLTAFFKVSAKLVSTLGII